MKLTHIDDNGHARMVDVSDKKVSDRTAIAESVIKMKRETWEMIRDRNAKKGDVLGVAQVAAIMATKKTPDMIPMCHAIWISGVSIDYLLPEEDDLTDFAEIKIRANVHCKGQTGVEMEALHAVSVAALTIYDMCKSVDRAMSIEKIRLLEKAGGKSGHYIAEK